MLNEEHRFVLKHGDAGQPVADVCRQMASNTAAMHVTIARA